MVDLQILRQQRTALLSVAPWVATDLTPQVSPVGKGTQSPAVTRIQEWLCVNRLSVGIDGDFGRITEQAVKDFQQDSGLPPSGIVDDDTYTALTAPMLSVAPLPAKGPQPGATLGQAAIWFAEQHLAADAREIGGENMGPWVRLYMRRKQGADQLWCAGFVSFVLIQAGHVLGHAPWLQYTVSCDNLAAQAMSAGKFLDTAKVLADPELLTPGMIFLKESTPGDWTHTGFVLLRRNSGFVSIEGNANAAGGRDGDRVKSNHLAFASRDFIQL